MKKHYTLFLIFTALISLSGCKKHADRITATTFTLNTTEIISESQESGYFFASGDPTVSGTFLMHIEVAGDSLHCDQTLTTTKGKIVIHSDCSLTSMEGTWFITEGSDAYWNLEGHGTLFMEFPKDSPSIEALSGFTWRR